MGSFDTASANASRLTFKIVMGTVIAAVVLIIGAVAWNISQIAAVDTFEECAAKYAVMDSYPQQCRTPDGRFFTAEPARR